MTNTLYLTTYELIEWWKRYETLGPKGGLRRRLVEAVEEHEKQLEEQGLPTARDIIRETAEKIL